MIYLEYSTYIGCQIAQAHAGSLGLLMLATLHAACAVCVDHLPLTPWWTPLIEHEGEQILQNLNKLSPAFLSRRELISLDRANARPGS